MSVVSTVVGFGARAATGPWRLYAELAIAALLVASCGYEAHESRSHEIDAAEAKEAFATYKAAADEQLLAAESRVRQVELDTTERLGRISNAADQRVAVATAAAASAASASERLRARVAEAVAAARRAGPRVATAAAGGAPAADPIGVLADVLGRADDRAGVLAAESDRRRIRALACEDAYEAARDGSLKANGR